MKDLKSNWKYYQASSLEQQQKDWVGCMKQICIVKNTPELLYTLDQVELAGLENFLDLNFFKQNIGPMWEDPSNVNGGRIIAEIPLSLKAKLPELWRKTAIFCALEPYNGINGCVYSEKANYRISIWIGDATCADDIIKACQHILGCEEITFAFSLHASKQSDGFRNKKKGSYQKQRDGGRN
ncbi:translation initiation factor eIF4E [Glugoides intestinalis]